MQASEPPQMRSASAMVQASRGGLEKYPNAGSRDQAQYCASSKNRSAVENVRPARRITVRMPMSPIAKPRLGSRTRDRSLVSNTDVIIRPARERRLNQRQPAGKEKGRRLILPHPFRIPLQRSDRKRV